MGESTAYLSNHSVLACPIGSDDFRCRIREAEAQACQFTRASGAAKVDYSPAVLPGQPHHVSRLQVTVHVSQPMEVAHPQGNLMHHLHLTRTSQNEKWLPLA